MSEKRDAELTAEEWVERFEGRINQGDVLTILAAGEERGKRVQADRAALLEATLEMAIECEGWSRESMEAWARERWG